MDFYIDNKYDIALDAYFSSPGIMSVTPDTVVILSNSAIEGYTKSTSPMLFNRFYEFIIEKFNDTIDYLQYRHMMINLVELQSGVDYSNFNNMSAENKAIALKWCNIRIANELGLGVYYSLCGSSIVGAGYIATHLTDASSARKTRYFKIQTLLYNAVGKLQGLPIESAMRSYDIVDKFILNGIVFNSIDGVDGIGDFFKSQSSFSTTGLLAQINTGAIVYSGDANVLCTSLSNIAERGYM